MKCPHCGWERIFRTIANWVSEEPTGNNIFVGVKKLDKFIRVYECDGCGYVWPKEEEK